MNGMGADVRCGKRRVETFHSRWERMKRRYVVFFERLCPHLECAVPTTRAKGHTIDAHPKTTDSVFVPGEHTDTLAFQGVPDVARPVVITTEEDAARDGERYGGDTAEDVVVRESVQFTVRPNIEQSARSIIRAGSKGIAVREELHSIDVRFVASEGLRCTTAAYIPQLGRGIASTRDEDILVGAEGQAHNVPGVVTELDHPHAGFDIPEHAGHVTRTGDNLPVVDESAATEITGVRAELSSTLDTAPLFAVEVVDGANVIQSTASHEVAGGRVSASHDPARPQGDGVDFVGGISVPDDKFAVLGGGHEVTAVGGPMHRVYFGEMAPERPARLHYDTRKGVDFCGHCAQAGIRRRLLLGTDLLFQTLRLPARGGDPLLNITLILRHGLWGAE